MLQLVDVGHHSIDTYVRSAGAEAVERLRELAEPLKGARILHLNATPYGGGVAEILRSQIPLLRDLGIEADWRLIMGGEAFFRATKAIHSGLQGSAHGLTETDREIYLENARHNAHLLEEEYDVYFIHDPQPLALLEHHDGNDGKWIWRCHIDTSHPDRDTWEFVRPYLEHYDAAVFTLGGFVPPGVPVNRVEIIPPAIDPESPKNMPLPERLAKRVLQWRGVDINRPMVVQVSRFDPWKDPGGAVRAFRLAREEVPNLQLALVGSMALDDPEGAEIYEELREATEQDPDIELYTNLTGVGSIEVNAFQRLADVAVQLSIREGFGLVVSETLWKRTPMIARPRGGIPLQMRDGVGGALVETAEQCAEEIVRFVTDPEAARRLASKGRTLVRERFLLTRLIADELRLYASVLALESPHAAPPAMAGLTGEIRDPVCGAAVDPASSPSAVYEGRVYHFIDTESRKQFLADPERFSRAEPEAEPKSA